MKYIRNIHKHSWYKIIRSTGAAPLGLCFWLSYKIYIINIHWYSSYIPYIFHTYSQICSIYFPLCFLIYRVKSRSGPERMTSFGAISHVSDPKLMILHGFAWRSLKSTVSRPTNLKKKIQIKLETLNNIF